MSSEERFGKLERRVKTVEEAIALLTALIAGHDERLEDSVKDNENLEAKIAALVDAQIRSDDKMREVLDQLSSLAERQVKSENKIENINEALDKLTELARASQQRLDRLEG